MWCVHGMGLMYRSNLIHGLMTSYIFVSHQHALTRDGATGNVVNAAASPRPPTLITMDLKKHNVIGYQLFPKIP